MGVFLLLIAGWVIFMMIQANASSDAASTLSLNAFEVQARRDTLKDVPGAVVHEIQGRGLFPISSPTTVTAYATVHDVTGGSPKPCLSFIEGLQEPETPFYLFETALGELKPGYGLRDWARISAVFTSAIQPPCRGKRTLRVTQWLVDARTPPHFLAGAPIDSAGILWTGTTEFEHEFTEVGYEEQREQRREARELTIQLGVCVAMADGELAASEGETIKAWVEKHLAAEPESARASVKQRYNSAMKSAFEQIQKKNLSIDWILSRLGELDDRAASSESVELCYQIMAADGVAAASEFEVVRHIATELGLDFREVEKLHDRTMVTLNAESGAHASIEVTLGIDPNWDRERIKKHLRQEFSKWNSRMAVLTDAQERANAQRMIDVIGEARKRYA